MWNTRLEHYRVKSLGLESGIGVRAVSGSGCVSMCVCVCGLVKPWVKPELIQGRALLWSLGQTTLQEILAVWRESSTRKVNLTATAIHRNAK